MPTYTAPIQDFTYLINEYLGLENYADVDGIKNAQELVEPLLEQAGKFCEEVLHPLNQVGDRQGLKYDPSTHSVTMPDGFAEAYKLYVEGGWPTLAWPTEYGGQGLPELLNMPMLEMVCSANVAFGLTPGLTHGAISAILQHGSEEQKQMYATKMITGEWSGVMCLTEPHSGTDLGLVRTRATPNADGSYKIEGNKIWISAGEHSMTENIVHLILARLPDAPEGSKGISLFVAPKFLVNADGSLGERNDFHCGGLDHKMGIHASPTCIMNYDGATAWLVGKPHKGLAAMFTMMNAARLYVGVQGLGIAEIARQNALAFANERLQGRALTGAKFPEKSADPIIVHPDVRRMLWTQKAITEGMRALTMETALQLDIAHRHPDANMREQADDFVQLMTPIVKGFQTDMGFDMASLGMQVFGGSGYIEEYGMAQFMRDSRIAMIYEGTNGIQAMDLVGRKMPAHMGRYLRSAFHPMDQFIGAHRGNDAMKEFIKPLAAHVKYLQQATLWLAAKGIANPNEAGAAAVEYARMFALVFVGYTWAKQAAIALQHVSSCGATPSLPLPLQGEGSSEAAGGGMSHAFYQSKLATARFYFAKILPQSVGLLASITNGGASVMAEGL